MSEPRGREAQSALNDRVLARIVAAIGSKIPLKRALEVV